jgi:hypothetical protein
MELSTFIAFASDKYHPSALYAQAANAVRRNGMLNLKTVSVEHNLWPRAIHFQNVITLKLTIPVRNAFMFSNTPYML